MKTATITTTSEPTPEVTTVTIVRYDCVRNRAVEGYINDRGSLDGRPCAQRWDVRKLTLAVSEPDNSDGPDWTVEVIASCRNERNARTIKAALNAQEITEE